MFENWFFLQARHAGRPDLGRVVGVEGDALVAHPLHCAHLPKPSFWPSLHTASAPAPCRMATKGHGCCSRCTRDGLRLMYSCARASTAPSCASFDASTAMLPGANENPPPGPVGAAPRLPEHRAGGRRVGRPLRRRRLLTPEGPPRPK